MKNPETIKRLIKQAIPWKLRYFIKLQEAKGYIRLPGSIKQFRSVEEYNDAFYRALRLLKIENFQGKAVCELGPGQHLLHPFLEYQMGAREEVLLEIDDFANVDSHVIPEGLELKNGYKAIRSLPAQGAGESWRSYLMKINAQYKTNGLQGYKELADNSIDYVFSFAVFEHIRKKEFIDTLNEIYRFLRDGGVAYQMVDYRDHLGGKKNHLRFPEFVWEDKDHYNMDNYTNRISCSEMCRMMGEAGFRIVKVKKRHFRKPPINRCALDKSFANMDEEDLLTAEAVIVARKN